MKNVVAQNDGFQVVQNRKPKGKQHARSVGFKPNTFVYRPVATPSGPGTSNRGVRKKMGPRL